MKGIPGTHSRLTRELIYARMYDTCKGKSPRSPLMSRNKRRIIAKKKVMGSSSSGREKQENIGALSFDKKKGEVMGNHNVSSGPPKE